MKPGTRMRKWLPVSALILLSACATPTPILELAGEGAATVGLAEISLREYVVLTREQLGARMDLIRFDAQQEARDRARREFDFFIDRKAGLPAKDDATALIRVLGDASRQIRQQEALEIEKIAESSTLDVSAVAVVPTEKLAAAKKSFSVLAKELTPQEWLALVAGYAAEIQAGVEKIKASLKEAK